MRCLMVVATWFGFRRFCLSSLQVSSSMDLMASIGVTDMISLMSALWARLYRSGFWGTRMRS